LILKLEVMRSSETFIGIRTQLYIPEDGSFYHHRCEDLSSRAVKVVGQIELQFMSLEGKL
jgi:hypothetical protein